MQKKQPVPEYYFSSGEWDRLGCGPLPPERDRESHTGQNTDKDQDHGVDSNIDCR